MTLSVFCTYSKSHWTQSRFKHQLSAQNLCVRLQRSPPPPTPTQLHAISRVVTGWCYSQILFGNKEKVLKMMHLSLTGQCPCAVLIPSSTKIRSKSQFSSDRWAEVFQAHFIHQAMRFYNFWGTLFYSMFNFIKYVVPNRSLCTPVSSWHLNHLFTTTVSSAKFLIILNNH